MYRVHLTTGFELTTLVVIGTDCTGSCKSNYHAIMTSLCCYSLLCIEEATNTNVIVLALYQTRFESTICHTRVQHGKFGVILLYDYFCINFYIINLMSYFSAAKSSLNHCPLCHQNVSSGEDGWKNHLMGKDGCKQNPRRLLTLNKNLPAGKS